MSKSKPRSTSPEAIKRRNAAFAKLSPERKRVTVAKDVIAALNAKRIKPVHNQYGSWSWADQYELFKLDFDERHDEYRRRDKLDAQEELLKGNVKCTACAIGAVFTCAVERMNNLTLKAMAEKVGRGMREYLGDVFSLEQLDLMEVAFEGTTEYVKSERYAPDKEDEDYDEGDCEYVCPYLSNGAQSELRAALNFMDEYDADKRMRAIMENIIANGGEFRP